jgi:hypothetical protein
MDPFPLFGFSWATFPIRLISYQVGRRVPIAGKSTNVRHVLRTAYANMGLGRQGLV